MSKRKSAQSKTTKKAERANTVGKKATAKSAVRKKTVKPIKSACSSTVAQKKPSRNASVKKTLTPTSQTRSLSSRSRLKVKRPDTEEISSASFRAIAQAKKQMPTVFKRPSKKNTLIEFSMEDLKEVLRLRDETAAADVAEIAGKSGADTKMETAPQRTSENTDKVVPEKDAAEHGVLMAASVADILGFNPTLKKWTIADETRKAPPKFRKYYALLLDLREHVLSELGLHTQDTLKRSTREDSGDLSIYSQHIADTATDTFDRDFALGLVSNEQQALNEIKEAIHRIFDNTYGICEATGLPINRERLEAVPFTRYSLEGQAKIETTKRPKAKRLNSLIGVDGATPPPFTDEDQNE